MQKIGNFEYPDGGTFKDALVVAEEALKNYGGVMPNEKVAEKLGYNIKDSKSISGWVYKRFDDFCMFGLTERGRGIIKSTELAVRALDPTKPKIAAVGKAEAIRKIPLIAKAFKELDGEIPTETAFPAKISEITNVSWIEAQKHVDLLKNLFNETFPILKEAPTTPPEQEREEEPKPREEGRKPELGTMTLNIRETGFEFLKTLPFTKEGIDTLKKLTEFLETQVSSEEKVEKEIEPAAKEVSK